MYEFTLNCNKRNVHFVDYAERVLNPVLKQMGGAVARFDDESKCSLALACDEPFILQAKSLVRDTVAEILAVGYKNLFLRRAMGISEGNFVLNTLVNTMCAFDNTYDKDCINAVVNVEQSVNLDGYYNFRISKVKDKWSEVADITVRNDLLQNGGEFVEEFLRYLVETVPLGISNLSVVVDSGTFQLFDTSGKLIVPTNTLYARSTLEEELMLNIICLRPKQISLYYGDALPSEDFVRMLKELFVVKEIKNS